MNGKLASVCTFIIMLILASCSKPEPPPLPESLKRLTEGNYKDWRLEKVTYFLLDVVNQIPSCQQDEIYRFYRDGRGEIRSGPVRCNENEKQVQTSGTWKFMEEGTKLHIDWQQKQSWDATIDALNDDKLVVTGIVFDNYKVTATFRPVQ